MAGSTVRSVFVRRCAFALLTLLPILGLPIRGAQAAGLGWSCEELNARWPQYHRDLHVAWPLGRFSCPSPMAKLAEAVALIHDVRVSNNSGMSYIDFYGWLTRTVPKLDYANEEAAGAMTHYHGQGTITIMNPFFKAPLIQRAAMLIHEARHSTWPSEPGHVTCEHGADKGVAGHCDAEFHSDGYSGGAYSWGWVFMWRVMEDPNAVPEEHDRILWQLKWELNNRFNSVREDDLEYFKSRWNWDGRT